MANSTQTIWGEIIGNTDAQGDLMCLFTDVKTTIMILESKTQPQLTAGTWIDISLDNKISVKDSLLQSMQDSLNDDPSKGTVNIKTINGNSVLGKGDLTIDKGVEDTADYPSPLWQTVQARRHGQWLPLTISSGYTSQQNWLDNINTSISHIVNKPNLDKYFVDKFDYAVGGDSLKIDKNSFNPEKRDAQTENVAGNLTIDTGNNINLVEVTSSPNNLTALLSIDEFIRDFGTEDEAGTGKQYLVQSWGGGVAASLPAPTKIELKSSDSSIEIKTTANGIDFKQNFPKLKKFAIVPNGTDTSWTLSPTPTSLVYGHDFIINGLTVQSSEYTYDPVTFEITFVGTPALVVGDKVEFQYWTF